MSKALSHVLADGGPCISVADGMRRATVELEAVRAGMENAFEVVHAHAEERAHESQRYLVAMQSIDALSQQIAAIERFLLNIAANFKDEHHVESHVAAAGITLAAVVARLTAAYDVEHASGECDFF